ncbi:MAG TPA: histidine phosphatase family protein [Dehalococcoidales bacterium]|nr:histidine phosphatase family protein [Dehalococcoidales bacterium]
MLELILVRHGETAWNVKEVFRGQSDIALNEVGMRQAQALSEYLANRKIEAIYCSPMARAVKTAEAVAARHNLQAMPVPELIDMNFGEWEGKEVTEVRKNYPDLFSKWTAHPDQVRVPRGDTLEDVAVRAKAFVENTAKKHQGTVVLVSHRIVHMILILKMLGLDIGQVWKIRMDTAAMTTFTLGVNGFCLCEHNNTCYLQGIESSGK